MSLAIINKFDGGQSEDVRTFAVNQHASQVFAGCMASFAPIVSFTPSPDNRMYFM